MHSYIVKNLSGTFYKVIRAANASAACIEAFKQHGAHPRGKLVATMITGKSV